MMLEFFRRTYYHKFDDDETSALTGRPYGLTIAAGSDAWGLQPVRDIFINRDGQPQDKTLKLLPNMSSRGLGEMQGSRSTSRGYFTFVEWHYGIVNEQMKLNGSIYETLFISMGTIRA
eukprot:scaffold58406_cov43-Cyclotella_meneghiniana.AAC.2